MSDAIFMEIANEIKSLNNHAMNLVNEGLFSEAEVYYEKALSLTSYLEYYDGMAMVYYNLANLEILKEDLLKALTYCTLAMEMHEKAETNASMVTEMLGKLAKLAMKKGMDFERKGDLQRALEYYYACVYFIEEKFQEPIQKEIELIEKVIANG